MQDSSSVSTGTIDADCEKAVQSGKNNDQEIDPFFVSALSNPKIRLTLLKLDQDLERFILDSSQHKLEFPPMSSYHRMLVHRVAQHFNLSHAAVDVDAQQRSVVLFKNPESKIPLVRFANMGEKEKENVETQPPKPVQIMKRSPNSENGGLRRSSNSSDKQSHKTLEERETEYEKAKAKIFSEAIKPPADSASSNNKKDLKREETSKQKARKQRPSGNLPFVGEDERSEYQNFLEPYMDSNRMVGSEYWTNMNNYQVPYNGDYYDDQRYGQWEAEEPAMQHGVFVHPGFPPAAHYYDNLQQVEAQPLDLIFGASNTIWTGHPPSIPYNVPPYSPKQTTQTQMSASAPSFEPGRVVTDTSAPATHQTLRSTTPPPSHIPQNQIPQYPPHFFRQTLPIPPANQWNPQFLGLPLNNFEFPLPPAHPHPMFNPGFPPYLFPGQFPQRPIVSLDYERRPPKSTELFDPKAPSNKTRNSAVNGANGIESGVRGMTLSGTPDADTAPSSSAYTPPPSSNVVISPTLTFGSRAVQFSSPPQASSNEAEEMRPNVYTNQQRLSAGKTY